MRRFGRIKLSFSDAILSADRLPKSDEIRSDSFRNLVYSGIFLYQEPVESDMIRWSNMTGTDGIFSGVIRSGIRPQGIRSNSGRIRQVLSRKTSDSGAIRDRVRSFPVGSTGWIESPGKVFLIQLNGYRYEKAFKDLSVGYRLIIMHLKCKKVIFCGKWALKVLSRNRPLCVEYF